MFAVPATGLSPRRSAPVGVRGVRGLLSRGRARVRRSCRVPLSFGFLSTYRPTQCGLATFTASLMDQLVAQGSRCGVVRIVDQPAPLSGRDVVAHLVLGSRASAAKAADALAEFDVAVVQHEFGIYGGPDGVDVLDVLDALTVPAIVVLHTVLTAPT